MLGVLFLKGYGMEFADDFSFTDAELGIEEWKPDLAFIFFFVSLKFIKISNVIFCEQD